MRVLRWGQSAYETDLDLAAEREGARGLGYSWDAEPRPDQRPDELSMVDVLVVTSKVRVDSSVLRAFERGMILTTTSGTDHLDLVGCRERGIVVGRCPMARRDAVVDHTLAEILRWARRLRELDGCATRGQWARARLPEFAPVGVQGLTVAVVGQGVIGRRVTKILTALGARVLPVDPRGVPAGFDAWELEDALAEAAVVTLHCDLNASSTGLFDAKRIAGLRRGALLVNTARGGLMDVDAAVAAVHDGHLSGLAVDVFPEEPWLRMREGTSVRGVHFSPHGAGFTRDLGRRVADEVLAALAEWKRDGSLPHRVA